MKISLQNCAVLFASVVLVSGCEMGGINSNSQSYETGGISNNSNPVSDGVPTYAQNQAVTLIEPYSITIDKCYWADEFEKPGFPTEKPSAKFLVLEFSIKNLSQSANTWPAVQPLIFMLKNARGSEYASTGQEVTFDDLTAMMIYGQISINPEMSRKGTKVFDVPQADYVMDVSIGRHTSGWSFDNGQTLFKWSLTPTDGK
jgi:hypothetical protein